ncbi:MAG: PTH1 family peptidyl-tRNA hydrolase [Planctomycetota bacterium]|jgi:PTH1 family peptidyl-tRNA hydrolase
MDVSVRRIVFGLGNPGSEYERTRHNVGFRVLEHLARREGLLFDAPTSLGGYSGPSAFRCARSFGPNVLLVQPLTFMNRSGEVVAPLADWAGLEPSDLLVVYDDMDLEVAKLRLRSKGGHGGQNGMRSILSSLGTDRFPRLRVGIGRSPTDAARHVLSPFTPEEEVKIEKAVPEAADAIFDWLRGTDIEGCMTRFHSRWNEGDQR